MENAIIVHRFIDQIWNRQLFEKFNDFVHPDFIDHSLPPALPPDVEGTKQWISNTGLSFEHHTSIEEQVTEGDKSIVKIRFQLKHVGPWRGIEPTGLEVEVMGYRYFKLKDGKIVEHWGLIDGQTIENQLMNACKGCKISR